MIKRTGVWLERNINLIRPAQFLVVLFISFGPLISVYSVFNTGHIIGSAYTVQVLVFDKNPKPISSGSGTIIDLYDDILTNYHVIGDALKKKGCTICVCITPDAQRLSSRSLLNVDFVWHSEPLDLALLRFTKIK